MGKSLTSVEWMAPGGNLTSYIQGVNAISVLSADEERMLAEELYYRDDLDAARQLVMSHLRFVVYIARSYNGYGLPLGDLIQEGNVGLMKAVKRFNPEKGVRLVSFAVHWVKAEIHEYILRNWRIVKVATTKAQRKLFFNLRSAKKSLSWLTQEEAEAVARDLGVEVKHVHEMEQRLAARDAIFDAPVDANEDEVYQVPSQYLEDHRYDPATLIERENWEEVSYGRLADAVGELDERSRDIIASRWLGDEKATLHDLASRYGISAERVRQIEQNAMKKVRAVLEA